MAERLGLLTPIYRGDALTLRFTHRSPPITGWTIKLYLTLASGNNNRVALTKDASLDDASAGKYSFAISSIATKSLPAGIYDLWVKRTDAGSETTIAVGQIELKTGA